MKVATTPLFPEIADAGVSMLEASQLVGGTQTDAGQGLMVGGVALLLIGSASAVDVAIDIADGPSPGAGTVSAGTRAAGRLARNADDVPPVVGMLFGRMMSKKEAKLLDNSGILVGGGRGASDAGQLVPTFYAPPHIQRRVSSMNRNELLDLYKTIGGRNTRKSKLTVRFFRPELEPVQGPIPARSVRWFNEYKFQSGTPVKVE